MSMKSTTMMPPKSRKRICRTISLGAVGNPTRGARH
jgi:hypothetical protein